MSFEDFWKSVESKIDRGKTTPGASKHPEWPGDENAARIYNEHREMLGKFCKQPPSWLRALGWLDKHEPVENSSTFRDGMDQQKSIAELEAKRAHFERDFARYYEENRRFWDRYVAPLQKEARNDDPGEDPTL